MPQKLISPVSQPSSCAQRCSARAVPLPSVFMNEYTITIHMDQFANLKNTLEQLRTLRSDAREPSLVDVRTIMNSLELSGGQLEEIMTDPELRGALKEAVQGEIRIFNKYFPDHDTHQRLNLIAYQVPYVDPADRLKTLGVEIYSLDATMSKTTGCTLSFELFGAKGDGKSRALSQLTELGVSVVHIVTRARASAGMPSRTTALADFVEHCTGQDFLMLLREILTVLLRMLTEGKTSKTMSQVAQEFSAYILTNEAAIVSATNAMSESSSASLLDDIDVLNANLKNARFDYAGHPLDVPTLLAHNSLPLTLIVFDHVSPALARNAKEILESLKLLNGQSQLLTAWVSSGANPQISPDFIATKWFSAGWNFGLSSGRTSPGGFDGQLRSNVAGYALAEAGASAQQLLARYESR